MGLSTGDPVRLLLAHELIGQALWSQGSNTQALAHLEQAAGIYDPVAHFPLAETYGRIIGVLIELYTGLSRLALGFPDTALKHARHAATHGRALDHPNAIAFGLMFESILLVCLRDAQSTIEQAAQCMTFADDEWHPMLSVWTRTAQACAQLENAYSQQVVDEIESSWAEWEGPVYWKPFLEFLIAQARISNGAASDAMKKLDETLAWTKKQRHGQY